MTVFYTDNGTLPRSVDYGFGATQCLMFILSSILNPVVFIFHFRTRKKASSLLLVLLSFSDFVSIVLSAPGSVYHFFRDERDVITPPTVLTYLLGVGQLLFYRLSLFLTSMLSVQRLVCIIYPRYVIKSRLIYMTLGAWLGIMTLSFVMYMVDFGIPSIVPHVQKFHLDETQGYFCVYDPMIQCISCEVGWDDIINTFLVCLFLFALVNIVSSVITIFLLLTRTTKVHGRKSVVTIVLLAISSSFMYAAAPIGAVMLRDFKNYNENSGTSAGDFYRSPEYEITFFLIVTFLPQITSVLNPIILIARGSQLREYVRESILGLERRSQHTSPKVLTFKSSFVA